MPRAGLASHETYDMFATQRGKSTAAYRAWLERTLIASLCAD